jgi:shikimate kinase / 3-dehydroquinate synthase
MKKIFLYGPPGSGKSTAGKALADSLGLFFLDLDEAIEQKAGMTIEQIMHAQGEAAFRELEAPALCDAARGPAGVIALGGGALLALENRELVESIGAVICLDAGLDILVARLSANGKERPLLAGDLRKKLSALLKARREHYLSFGSRIDGGRLDPGQLAWQLQVAAGRFRVGGMGADYDVIVQPGGLDGLGSLLREHRLDGPVALVTERNVGLLYTGRAVASLQDSGYPVQVLTNPAGEDAKTLETVSGLWQAFLQSGLDRCSTVVALGGGVTGDLAGFAAATYLRGVPWVAVPTSLLAMVDASLGGKTGIDLPEGKNLVGAFHPPRLVLADPETLSTLPEVELRSGLAEVVKHGIIADPALFQLCAAGPEAVKGELGGIVRRAMAVKVAVIQADPYERGPRAALNLGHTVGHAVESVSGYRLRHGEAVAIGMVTEARLAERLGIAAAGLSGRIAAALVCLDLPVEIPPELPRQALVEAMRVDKKKAAGVVRFSLPADIGRVETGVAVEDLSSIFSGGAATLRHGRQA